MTENTAGWSETAQEVDKDDNLSFNSLITNSLYIPSSCNQLLLELSTLDFPGANKLNLSYSWS